MSIKNYVDETALPNAVPSFEKKAVLLTPQPLTEARSRVRETLEIDSVSSELTSITIEYDYDYDGDVIGIKWIRS